jgi:hypothetical protein
MGDIYKKPPEPVRNQLKYLHTKNASRDLTWPLDAMPME